VIRVPIVDRSGSSSSPGSCGSAGSCGSPGWCSSPGWHCARPVQLA